MKKLITVADVKNLAVGQKVIYVESGTIITPAAKDAAGEHGVTIKYGTPPDDFTQGVVPESCSTTPNTCTTDNAAAPAKLNGVSPDLVARIVQEVLAAMPGLQQNQEPIKEEDPSGLRLIRGNTVKCEEFNTGNPKDRVGIKEILTIKESPNMATGFMTLEESTFSWDLKYEEIDYIIEGTLEMTVDGRTYRGTAGDVFYLPSNKTVTFSSPDKAKFFFVTYPANWAELSNYQK